MGDFLHALGDFRAFNVSNAGEGQQTGKCITAMIDLFPTSWPMPKPLNVAMSSSPCRFCDLLWMTTRLISHASCIRSWSSSSHCDCPKLAAETRIGSTNHCHLLGVSFKAVVAPYHQPRLKGGTGNCKNSCIVPLIMHLALHGKAAWLRGVVVAKLAGGPRPMMSFCLHLSETDGEEKMGAQVSPLFELPLHFQPKFKFYFDRISNDTPQTSASNSRKVK